MMKNQLIVKYIKIAFSIGSIGLIFRRRRLSYFLELVKETFKENGEVTIADIGGTKDFWNMLPNGLLIKYNMHITIVNQKNIHIPIEDKNFTYVRADACNLSIFKDKLFNIAHSNSVIEHVGNWERMVLFSKEISRIANKYFVQTPDFWFPVEPHCMTLFYHWAPKKVQIILIKYFSLGHWTRAKSYNEAINRVESIHLLDKKKINELFSDATIYIERFFGLPKSILAVRK